MCPSEMLFDETFKNCFHLSLLNATVSAIAMHYCPTNFSLKSLNSPSVHKAAL